MQRSDGYSMVGGWIQGVRAFNPTSGQWLTPDAYAGDVHDPMSQKPFMWNNNNPFRWADPSGYVAEVSTSPDTGNPQQTDVNITLYVKFDGNGANAQTEQAAINAIEKTWSGAFGNYNVTTSVVTNTTNIPASEVNTITITSGGTSAHAGVDQLNNHMTIGDDVTNTYGFAHEAGHLMGLPDMYDNVKSVMGQTNLHYGKPLAGHEGDIMATRGGLVSQYDIGKIISSPMNFAP